MAKFQSPFEWGFCICNFGPTNQKSFLQFPLAHFCYFTNFQYIFFFKQQNNSWYLNISQHVKHTTGIRILAWDLWNNHSDTTWVKKMGFNSSEGFQRKPVFPAGRWTICSTIGMGASFCSLTFTREIELQRKCPYLKADLLFQLRIILQLSNVLEVKGQRGASWYCPSTGGSSSSDIISCYLRVLLAPEVYFILHNPEINESSQMGGSLEQS